MSEHESVKMSDHESLERLRRNRSNLGFQSATGRTRRGEPDRSCRLPSPQSDEVVLWRACSFATRQDARSTRQERCLCYLLCDHMKNLRKLRRF